MTARAIGTSLALAWHTQWTRRNRADSPGERHVTRSPSSEDTDENSSCRTDGTHRWSCCYAGRARGSGIRRVNEIGSCAIARGFATTASPCRDASTIYWNSAAAAWLPGWNVTAGVAAVSVNGSFHQDTTGRRFNADVPTSWVPHVFVNYHSPTSKFAWGLGVYVPYGLTSQWGTDFPGRFEAQKATLSTFYVQPNVAWQINSKWSIGGGPVYGHSNVELIQAIDLSTQLTAATAGAPTFGQLGVATGTEFAQATIKGSGNRVGRTDRRLGASDRPLERRPAILDAARIQVRQRGRDVRSGADRISWWAARCRRPLSPVRRLTRSWRRNSNRAGCSSARAPRRRSRIRRNSGRHRLHRL